MIEENPIEQPIDGILDLHTFQPGDVKDLVPEYLAECLQRRVYEVRIIHGKGTGALRTMVRSVLEKLPYVESIRTADETEGGWGATIVSLGHMTEVCHCPCHVSPHIVHPVPCCMPCSHCKKNISKYFYEAHVKACAKKKKAG